MHYPNNNTNPQKDKYENLVNYERKLNKEDGQGDSSNPLQTQEQHPAPTGLDFLQSRQAVAVRTEISPRMFIDTAPHFTSYSGVGNTAFVPKTDTQIDETEIQVKQALPPSLASTMESYLEEPNLTLILLQLLLLEVQRLLPYQRKLQEVLQEAQQNVQQGLPANTKMIISIIDGISLIFKSSDPP